MVLNSEIKMKLMQQIAIAPCSIQELAIKFGKNWRTIDGYISKLEEEGLVRVKEFKKGSRVAFKIVFIQPDADFQVSNVQKKILRQIESGKRSQDFSPLNIIQYISEKEVNSYFKSNKVSTNQVTEDLVLFLKSASTSLLLFSGDLSWIDLKTQRETMLDIMEQLAKEKVSIKIIARVDHSTKKRIEKLLNVNYKLGYDAIEIHHEEHSLRCFILDGRIARFKEPSFSTEKGELRKIGNYFYQTTEVSWINWLERVFWSMFRTSVPASKRLEILDKIEELKH